MQKKSKKPKLAELLACRSVKAIVALLKKYKVKGATADSCDCPLSRFVKKTGVKNPQVDSFGGCSDYHEGVTVFGEDRIRRAFIARFDDGKIPELVA